MRKVAQISLCAVLALCAAVAQAADKMSATQLIALAKSKDAGLHDAILANFEAKNLKDGTAWSGRGPDFFFAIEASSQPSLVIDEKPQRPFRVTVTSRDAD